MPVCVASGSRCGSVSMVADESPNVAADVATISRLEVWLAWALWLAASVAVWGLP